MSMLMFSSTGAQMQEKNECAHPFRNAHQFSRASLSKTSKPMNRRTGLALRRNQLGEGEDEEDLAASAAR